MITRVWECRVVPETAEELLVWIEQNSWPKVRIAEGFLGGALYTPLDHIDRIVTVSHWAGPEAIAAYAGPSWRSTPIVYDEERPFLVGEPGLTHYVRVHDIAPQHQERPRTGT